MKKIYFNLPCTIDMFINIQYTHYTYVCVCVYLYMYYIDIYLCLYVYVFNLYTSLESLKVFF